MLARQAAPAAAGPRGDAVRVRTPTALWGSGGGGTPRARGAGGGSGLLWPAALEAWPAWLAGHVRSFSRVGTTRRESRGFTQAVRLWLRRILSQGSTSGMGSQDGDAATASEQQQAAVIADLQAKLEAALAANKTLLASRDGDTEEVPPGTEAEGAVHPGRAGDGAPATGGRKGKKSERAGGGSGAGGKGKDGSSASSTDDSGGGGGGGSGGDPSFSSSSSTDSGRGFTSNPWADLDSITVGKPGDYLRDFDIPRRAVRPGGLPIPFEPNEVEFLTAFADNVRDRMEAVSLYHAGKGGEGNGLIGRHTDTRVLVAADGGTDGEGGP